MDSHSIGARRSVAGAHENTRSSRVTRAQSRASHPRWWSSAELSELVDAIERDEIETVSGETDASAPRGADGVSRAPAGDGDFPVAKVAVEGRTAHTKRTRRPRAVAVAAGELRTQPLAGEREGVSAASEITEQRHTQSIADAWRSARARLDAALATLDAQVARPVSEWPRNEHAWRDALRELESVHKRLSGDEAQALVEEWRARVLAATGEIPRRPWSQLELWGAR